MGNKVQEIIAMLKIAATKVDVTPGPNGLIGQLPVPDMQPPRDPLFARLFLVDDGSLRILAVSVDYCTICGEVQDEWTARLAAAVSIRPDKVMLHCEHIHDAPAITREMAKYMPDINWDWTWLDPIIGRLETAAASLPDKLTRVAKMGWAETRLSGYASNRRVVMPDGSIATRFSRCGEHEVRDRATGTIDPMLRTLGFYGQDNSLLAAWSFYATHPQVANQGYRYGADAPGEASRQLEERFPQAICGFFNGCLGNLTAGKFSAGYDLEWNISHFGTMLADGITRNLTAPEFFTSDKCAWETAEFPFPAHVFTDEELAARAEYADTIPPALKGAADYAAEHPEFFTFRLLTLGDAKIIFMEGELFVEYQLYLQSLIPNEKLGVVGLCGDNFYYIGTAEAVSDPNGYEMKSFCRVRPEFEELFKKTAKDLLIKF